MATRPARPVTSDAPPDPAGQPSIDLRDPDSSRSGTPPRHGVVRLDLRTGLLHWSDDVYRLHNRPRWQRVRSLPEALELVHPGDSRSLAGAWEEARRRAQQGRGQLLPSVRYRASRPDGSLVALALQLVPLPSTDHPEILGIVTLVERAGQSASRNPQQSDEPVRSRNPGQSRNLGQSDEPVRSEASRQSTDPVAHGHRGAGATTTPTRETPPERTSAAGTSAAGTSAAADRLAGDAVPHPDLRDARIAFLEDALSAIPDLAFVYDPERGRVVEVVAAGAAPTPAPWSLQVHPDDVGAHQSWLGDLARLAPDEVAALTVRMREGGDRPGPWRWCDERATSLAEHPSVLVVIRDTDESIRGEVALADDLTRYQHLFESAPVGMAVLDATSRVLTANSALAGLVGRPVMELVGRPYPLGLNADLPPVDATSDQRLIHQAGHDVWVRVSDARIVFDGRPCRLLAFSDISAEKETEAGLRHAALHDQLTGLPNRRLLVDRLDGALARARRRSSLVAVFFVDLDGLKRINDTYGHDAGDAMIVASGEALRTALRDADTLARLGGDEFVAICEDLDGDDAVLEIGTRLLDAIHRPITLGEDVIGPSASVGVAVPEADADTAEDLLRRADGAMYTAKALGGSRLASAHRRHASALVNGGRPATRPAATSGDAGDAFGTARAATPEQVVGGAAGDIEAIRAALVSGRLLTRYEAVRSPGGDLVAVRATLHQAEGGSGTPGGPLGGTSTSPELQVPLATHLIGRALTELRDSGWGGVPLLVTVGARALLRTQLGDVLADRLAQAGRAAGLLTLEVPETEVGVLLRRGASPRALERSGVALGVTGWTGDAVPLGSLRRLHVRTVGLDPCLLATPSWGRAQLQVVEATGAVALATGVDDAALLRAAIDLGVTAMAGLAVAAPVGITELAGLALSPLVLRWPGVQPQPSS